jgi:hypothetical protein
MTRIRAVFEMCVVRPDWRITMRRTYLRVITIVIVVCGLVGLGLRWRVGSNFHLQHLSC